MDEALKKTLGFGTKEFITRAIEGGWQYPRTSGGYIEKWEMSKDPNYFRVYGKIGKVFGAVLVSHVSEVMLDPHAWISVGKVEGWVDKNYPNGEMHCENKLGRCEERYCSYSGYKNPIDLMHRFIDALVEEAGV